MGKASRRKSLPPARTPEQRESQLINLAMDSAEELMINGKAPSQIITHFLKLGAARAQYELEKLKAETDLAREKVENIRHNQRTDEMYEEALAAFTDYNGDNYEDDEDDYYD